MGYIIRAKTPIEGKHWELTFHKGVSETDDARIAAAYRKRGYDVIAPTASKRKAERKE